MNQTYLQIITIIVVVASTSAAWVRRYYAKKGLQFNALIKAFELLNDNAHRNARIRLYRVSQVSCRMSLFHLPNLLSRYSDTAAFLCMFVKPIRTHV